jgi:uncharacterized protein YxjI
MNDQCTLEKRNKDGKLSEAVIANDDSQKRINYETGKETLEIRRKEKLCDLTAGTKLGKPREISAAKRVCSAINIRDHTEYDAENPIETEENGLDAIFKSKDGNELKIQVTRAEGELVGRLGKMKQTSPTPLEVIQERDVEETFQDLLNAINKKTKYNNKNEIILVLEGLTWILEKELDEFKDRKKEELKKFGFKEIWYVPDEMASATQLI